MITDAFPTRRGRMEYVCTQCGARRGVEELLYTCPECGGGLRGGGQAEAQKPGLPAGKRGEGFVHLRFDLQKAARGLHVDLPGGRERNGRGAPLEDGLAELLLDLPNLLGERRLGDKERFCRGGEAAFADNGEHELSVACIHGGFPLCDLISGAPKAPISLF